MVFNSVTGKMVEAPYVGVVKFTVSDQGTEMIPGVIDPKAASIEVLKYDPKIMNGQKFFFGSTIRVTRTDGTRYQMAYVTPDDVRSLVPLTSIDNAPVMDSDEKIRTFQKGLSVSADTHIMKTNIPNAMIDLLIAEIPTETQPNHVDFFSGIRFMESSDGKMLYPAK